MTRAPGIRALAARLASGQDTAVSLAMAALERIAAYDRAGPRLNAVPILNPDLFHEARASDAYKQAVVDATSDDIVYSNLFTGVHGNYLAASIRNAGLDPEHLPESDPSQMNFGSGSTKAWKDIWGCGQGIGVISSVVSTAELVARLKREYQAARARLTL